MKRHIIFSQQAADIHLIITLYEQLKLNNEKIEIYCINVENNYKFINSLNLKINSLVFIPYPKFISFKNPLQILKNKKYLTQTINKHFNNISNADIYFFAKGLDWFTTAIVNYLIKYNNVFYKPAVPLKINIIKPNLKERFILLIYYFMASTKYQYGAAKNMHFMVFDNEKITEYNLNLVDIDKYKQEIVSIEDQAILFLDVNITPFKLIKDYDETTKNIIKELKQNGYIIYRKSHPRIGGTHEIEKYICNEIPSYIPIEFLKFKKFKFIFGVLSNSLAELAKKDESKVFSIVDLYEFYKPENYNVWRNKLVSDSENKVKFVKKTSDLQ